MQPKTFFVITHKQCTAVTRAETQQHKRKDTGRTHATLISMSAKGILQPGCSVSKLTLATVRRVDEARDCGNLMELCAVILPANQSRFTPHIVVPVAVCDRVT